MQAFTITFKHIRTLRVTVGAESREELRGYIWGTDVDDEVFESFRDKCYDFADELEDEFDWELAEPQPVKKMTVDFMVPGDLITDDDPDD